MSLGNDGFQSKNDYEFCTPYSQLSVLYSQLKQYVNYARRCSEGFRTSQWKWSLLRLKITERLAYMRDTMRLGAHEQFLETATQLVEDLSQDRAGVEELLTIFNEYLGYSADVRKMIENTASNSLSDVLFNFTKDKYPELLPRIKLVECSQEKFKVFDLVSVLELDSTTIVGGEDILCKTIELLRFLSFHWGIIEELSFIDCNRGPVRDINLFPEKFLDGIVWEDKKPCYYDLVSNLSVSSALQCTLNSILAVSADEWLQQGYHKLDKLQKAMENRTKRMDLLLEFMISET